MIAGAWLLLSAAPAVADPESPAEWVMEIHEEDGHTRENTRCSFRVQLRGDLPRAEGWSVQVWPVAGPRAQPVYSQEIVSRRDSPSSVRTETLKLPDGAYRAVARSIGAEAPLTRERLFRVTCPRVVEDRTTPTPAPTTTTTTSTTTPTTTSTTTSTTTTSSTVTQGDAASRTEGSAMTPTRQAPAAGARCLCQPAVVRRAEWYVRASPTTGTADLAFAYGDLADVPLVGDWNGDGIATPGVSRNGIWHLRNSSSTGTANLSFGYGDPGDVPLVGDWNGDGIASPGVFRNGMWHLRNSGSTGTADLSFGYGDPGDVPLVGDWNGDGIASPGVFRRGMWHLRNANGTGTPNLSFGYGDPGDVPVVGDWDGDGIATPGVFRNGIWLLRDANGGGTAFNFAYGSPGDRPLTYSSDPSSTVVSAALSPRAADHYTFVGGPARVLVSAPATNSDSNLRDLYWPMAAPKAVDGMSCATWTSQAGPIVQQGAALRIVLVGTTPVAITVTKNIWLGGFWIFNVHVWLGPYGSLVGQFDLGEVFRRPGSNDSMPLPWHLCARAVGPVVDFKAWLAAEVEPAWGDPKHGGSVALSSSWVYPGKAGWYIGHLFPNDTAQLDDLTTG